MAFVAQRPTRQTHIFNDTRSMPFLEHRPRFQGTNIILAFAVGAFIRKSNSKLASRKCTDYFFSRKIKAFPRLHLSERLSSSLECELLELLVQRD